MRTRRPGTPLRGDEGDLRRRRACGGGHDTHQAAFRQQFANPNDLDRMLSYNKFGVTAKDLPGIWVRNAGGGVEYYNAYTRKLRRDGGELDLR